MSTPSPTFPTQFVLDVIYPAAVAAYTAMDNASFPLPAGFAAVGRIEAQAQRVQALMAAASLPQQRIARAMLADSNIFGFVAWNAATATALVAFRGTRTPGEWLEDFDALPVPYLPVSGAGMVHMGFQLAYEHVRFNVGQLLASGCTGCRRILVTGHSLGGALAVLAGVDIARNVALRVIPELYTFAGPRTGAPDFHRYFQALIPVCDRVVNKWDLVPNLPPPGVYEHVGQAVVVNGGFTLDPAVAHSLESYQTGLQKLLPPAPAPALREML